MKIETTNKCPKKVRAQLLEWQKKGWLMSDECLPQDEPSDDCTQLDKCNGPSRDLTIEEQWCKKLKDIANAISETLNQKTIETNARGISGSYVFEFDSEGFCKMMDQLILRYRRDISQYLHGTKKPTGVTFVCSFFGEILNALIFNEKKIQKVDLAIVFKNLGYDGDVAVKKLSTHHSFDRSQDKKLLREKTLSIGRQLTVKAE